MDWWYDLGLVLLGAVIGWFSGRNTSKRVDETHDKLKWLIKGMEAEGMVTFKRDDGSDKITGVVIYASAAAHGTSSATAEGTVTRADSFADTRETSP